MIQKEEKLLDNIHSDFADENFDNVIEIAQRGMIEFPEQILFYISIAIANTRLGNFEEALTLLEKADKKFPGDYEIIYQTAKVYEEMGNYVEAVKFFRRSIEATPEDNLEAKADCLNDIGALNFNSGKEAEGIEYWKKALEIDPKNKKANSNLFNIDPDGYKELMGEYDEEEFDEDFEDDYDNEYDPYEIDFAFHENFNLFKSIQKDIFLKSKSRKEFISEEEEDLVNRHILTAWTNEVAGKFDTALTMKEDKREELFREIKIDFDGPLKEVELPVLDIPLYNELNKKLSFLPPNGLSYIISAQPFLEAVGISPEKLEEYISGKEISEKDKENFIWVYELGLKFFRMAENYNDVDVKKSIEDILELASRKISRKKAEIILFDLLKELKDGMNE